MVIPYLWRGGGAKPLFYLLYVASQGERSHTSPCLFLQIIKSLMPSPGFPFRKPVGDELFRAWLQQPKVLRLNPWSLAAPGSFLKEVWCRQTLEARRTVLSVVAVLVACLSGAVVTAAKGCKSRYLFLFFYGVPLFPSFLQIIYS